MPMSTGRDGRSLSAKTSLMQVGIQIKEETVSWQTIWSLQEWQNCALSVADWEKPSLTGGEDFILTDGRNYEWKQIHIPSQRVYVHQIYMPSMCLLPTQTITHSTLASVQRRPWSKLLFPYRNYLNWRAVSSVEILLYRI